MNKVAWRSELLVYEARDDHFEAARTMDLIFVVNVAPSVSVRCLSDLTKAGQVLRDKLAHCPFMVEEEHNKSCTAISAVDVVREWQMDDHPLLPSDLAVEEDYVFINHSALLTTYERSGAQYALRHAEQLFCTTTCMPKTYARDGHRHIGAFQRLRERALNTQMDASRIMLVEDNNVSYLHGADFTLFKTFA